MVLLLAQTTFGESSIGWTAVPASLILVGVTFALAYWLKLGISKDLLIASVRAAVQLMAVGVFFRYIFTSAYAYYWAWAWILVMIMISSLAARRRASTPVSGITPILAAAITFSTGVSLAAIFGFSVLELTPVSLLVVAGITIGNAMTASALGQNRAAAMFRERSSEVEGLLSLGMNRNQIVQFMAPAAARTALLPHIERTKIVGLIALPGAMTGLLLAGMNPIDAVVIQLLVMYLVLGTAAICAIATIVAVSRAAITDGLRLADWTRTPD